MRSQMAPETSRLRMPQASISDSICWATRRAQVAAVGDDKKKPGIAIATQQATAATQQHPAPSHRQAERPPARSRPADTAGALRPGHRRRRRHRPQEDRQQRHRSPGAARPGRCGWRAIPFGDEVLHHRWAGRAPASEVAAGADGHRDAAPAHEPERGVGHQRREGALLPSRPMKMPREREAGQPAGQAWRGRSRSPAALPRPPSPRPSRRSGPPAGLMNMPPTPKPPPSAACVGQLASPRALPIRARCTAGSNHGHHVQRRPSQWSSSASTTARRTQA